MEPDAVLVEERFADRLRHLRALRGLSLQQLAVAAGCTKPHVWELETGRSANPSLKITEGLAQALEADPSWLAGWGGHDPFLPPEPDPDPECDSDESQTGFDATNISFASGPRVAIPGPPEPKDWTRHVDPHDRSRRQFRELEREQPWMMQGEPPPWVGRY